MGAMQGRDEAIGRESEGADANHVISYRFPSCLALYDGMFSYDPNAYMCARISGITASTPSRASQTVRAHLFTHSVLIRGYACSSLYSTH